jgi:hypothetical protein
VTLLPALGPGVAEGFAAGTLLSAACLLLVIALQRARWQRESLPRPVRQRSILRAVRWRRSAAQTEQTWSKAPVPVPPPAPAAGAPLRTPVPRSRGRHAAPPGSARLVGRRRSRLLTTKN